MDWMVDEGGNKNDTRQNLKRDGRLKQGIKWPNAQSHGTGTNSNPTHMHA